MLVLLIWLNTDFWPLLNAEINQCYRSVFIVLTMGVKKSLRRSPKHWEGLMLLLTAGENILVIVWLAWWSITAADRKGLEK